MDGELKDKLPGLGTIISQRCTFEQADFDAFARLSGDDNPIHVDPAFAAGTRFGRTVAHGMFLYGAICGLLSEHFPGARQQEQSLMFPAPTFAGEEMLFQAEIVETDDDKRQAQLVLTITNPDGGVVCDGRTVLRWPG